MEIPLYLPQEKPSPGQLSWDDYAPAMGFLPPDLDLEEEKRREEVIAKFPEILKLDGNQLMDFIRKDLSRAELAKHEDSPDAESKLGFLVGPGPRNIANLTTIEGRRIYAKAQEYSKISETDEFLSAANSYIHEGGSVVELASEAADLFYNLARLIDLDKGRHKLEYEDFMVQIAGRLGWTKREALLVTAVKYYTRYVINKDKKATVENAIIEDLFESKILMGRSSPFVSKPSFKQADVAAEYVDSVKDEWRYRYVQLRRQKERKSQDQKSWLPEVSG